jgi:hypothetical protein
MSEDDRDAHRTLPWTGSLIDRVDIALRSAEPPENALFFASVNDGDGWLLEERVPGVVYVRWSNTHGSGGPGDHALQARLLDPVERFLHRKHSAVTRHRDERGPSVRVTW